MKTMFVNTQIDKWSANTVLGTAITLYELAYKDKRYGKEKKKSYKERLLRWIAKYNVPIELVVEKAGK